MFSTVDHNLKALLIALFLCGGAFAERYNGVDPHARDYYQTEIEQNKGRLPPQQAGESDAEYRVRMSHLYPEYTKPPTAQDDVAAGTGTLDRAVKLDDAAAIAQEGANASAAQAAEMVTAGIALGLDLDAGSAMGSSSASAAQTAEAMKLIDAGSKYGQINSDMLEAVDRNREGAARLRFDPEDGDGAGTPGSKEDQVRGIVDSLSDKNKEVLAQRGVDAEQLVERLLSGEIDTSDPAAILRELKDPRQLSVEDLNEVKALAEADSASGAELAAQAGDSAGKDLAEGRELTTGSDSSGKDLKDPAKAQAALATAEATGFGNGAIQLINKELIGRAKKWMGGGKDKKAGRTPASEKASSERVAQVKAALKKHLSAKAYYDLQDRGITAPRFGTNIFKMAHRQYREYHKWREKRTISASR